MSVWQRIGDFLGSFAERTGLAGSLANALDPDNWVQGGRDAAFTLAIVALSAKMAVADGVVTASELRAFREFVTIPEEAKRDVDRLFNLAKEDVAGYESYARKIRRLFDDSPDTLELVLDSLFRIAAADGLIHENELDFLKSVSDIFGFDEALFEQIAAQHIEIRSSENPYLALGLDRSASNEEIRRVYRTLMSENHPDRLAAKGIPDEMIVLMSQKVASINAAYDRIRRERGLDGKGTANGPLDPVGAQP